METLGWQKIIIGLTMLEYLKQGFLLWRETYGERTVRKRGIRGDLMQEKSLFCHTLQREKVK